MYEILNYLNFKKMITCSQLVNVLKLFNNLLTLFCTRVLV